MLKLKTVKYLLPIFLTLVIMTTSYCTFAAKQITKSDTTLIDKGSFVPLYKYMAENIRYPESARESQTQGTVIISFDLTDKGLIANAVVKNAEAIYQL